jgi:hypothetical protein
VEQLETSEEAKARGANSVSFLLLPSYLTVLGEFSSSYIFT